MYKKAYTNILFLSPLNYSTFYASNTFLFFHVRGHNWTFKIHVPAMPYAYLMQGFLCAICGGLTYGSATQIVE